MLAINPRAASPSSVENKNSPTFLAVFKSIVSLCKSRTQVARMKGGTLFSKEPSGKAWARSFSSSVIPFIINAPTKAARVTGCAVPERNASTISKTKSPLMFLLPFFPTPTAAMPRRMGGLEGSEIFFMRLLFPLCALTQISSCGL
jgi:hypothetical protein